MKLTSIILIVLIIGAGFAGMVCPTISAEDLRANRIEAERKKAELLGKVIKERDQAVQEAKLNQKKILSEEKSILTAIEQLEKNNYQLKKENRRLEKKWARLKNRKEDLIEKEHETGTIARELVGFIKVNLKDLDVLITRSLQSAFIQNRGDRLKGFLSKDTYPGMKEVQEIVEILLQEIKLSGEVRITKTKMVGQTGEDIEPETLVLGNFTAIYQWQEAVGFATYSEKSKRLYTLSKLPGRTIQNSIKEYLAGTSEEVPIDITRGAALRQVSSRPNLIEQVTSGGPVVWPILGILLIGFLLICERILFLLRKQLNSEKLVHALNALASEGKWNECLTICEKVKNKPVSIVLQAAIKNREMSREELENVLQETILGQIPPLERFLSTLGMMASIAPLLGLLGTVTGMINTFHTITYFGTGDAKMMSGGISEALITTMLGLAVAIPIMFCHTLISRSVENIIAQMEEKAVSFINTIEKTKEK